MSIWGSASPLVTAGQTWLNGVAVDGTTTNRPQTMSVLSVLTTGGVSADRLFAGKTNYPWVGDIAELVVYTQPLTSSQRKSVEDYLALKYAAYVGTAGAPEFTPERGDVRGLGGGVAAQPDARSRDPLHDGRQRAGGGLEALRGPARAHRRRPRCGRAPSARE